MIEPRSPSTGKSVKLYSLTEVRLWLGLSPYQIGNFMRAGLLRPVRYSFRRLYFSEGEIERFLATALGTELAERMSIRPGELPSAR